MIKLDLEEKGGTGFVRRCARVLPRGRFCDVSADDEPFYSLSIPFSCLGTGVCEILNFLEGVKDYGGSFDETPLVSKRVYDFSGKCFEFLAAYVETM
jgi:hypothetical protein